MSGIEGAEVSGIKEAEVSGIKRVDASGAEVAEATTATYQVAYGTVRDLISTWRSLISTNFEWTALDIVTSSFSSSS